MDTADPIQRRTADRAWWDAFVGFDPQVELVVRSTCCLEGGLTFQEWFLDLWRELNAPMSSYGLRPVEEFVADLEEDLRIRECYW